MASVDFPLTEKALREMADYQVRRAKLELGVVRKRKRVKAKWEDGVPKTFTIKESRGRAVASGALQKSISYALLKEDGRFRIPFVALHYALDVEKGMPPFKKGFVIPPNRVSRKAIGRWIKAKRLRPRDLKTNQFIKMTKANMNSMEFLITRSISYFGREPLPFMQTAKEAAAEKYLPSVRDAFKADLSENIKKQFGKL